MAVRDEAKEMRPDASLQAWKSRRRIYWNTLRIFQAENDIDGRGSFVAVERPMSDRLRRATVARRFPTIREREDSDYR